MPLARGLELGIEAHKENAAQRIIGVVDILVAAAVDAIDDGMIQDRALPEGHRPRGPRQDRPPSRHPHRAAQSTNASSLQTLSSCICDEASSVPFVGELRLRLHLFFSSTFISRHIETCGVILSAIPGNFGGAFLDRAPDMAFHNVQG